MTDKKDEKKTVIKSILSKVTEFANSQGIADNSHPSPSQPFDLLSYVLDDVVLRAALEIKHSTISKIGYHFKHKLSKKDAKLLKKIRFDKWLSQMYWQVAIYKNCFTEYNTLSNGKVVGLSIIKTDEVEIVNLPNGVVTGYLQLPTNPQSKKRLIEFPKDKIFHISTNNISTSLWGDSELNTLLPVLRKKQLVEDYINWLFESNQFRSVIKIPSTVSEDDIEQYMDMLKEGMINPTNMLVLQGDQAQVDVLRKIEGFSELLSVLDYYRSQILSILQLPPLQVGILESSNRSSSEYQVRYAFYTSIVGMLNEIKDEINNELLPRLGIDNEFMHNLVDDKTKNDLLDMAQKLANMGADPTKLNEWLIDQGLDIPSDLLSNINDNKNMIENSNLKLTKNSDLHPSRQHTKMDFAGGSTKNN